jgi:hypothetical protein
MLALTLEKLTKMNDEEIIKAHDKEAGRSEAGVNLNTDFLLTINLSLRTWHLALFK